MGTRFSRKKLDKYSRTARPDVNSIRSEHDDDATSEHSMNEKKKKAGKGSAAAVVWPRPNFAVIIFPRICRRTR